MTGGEAAVKSLKKEKVEHVFGLIGSATMEMFDALYHEKKIKFIGVRDERTGTHMAFFTCNCNCWILFHKR
jgi:thiamine pyrophosphate-dependent acetolactate synthase large subunit-like protein